jgi:long-subunit fatty acid transport protein
MARLHRWLGTGLAGLVTGLSLPLAAQSLWLPASDPVGIGRGGTGVAFGQSLEGATLNPALLVTLKGTASAYVGLGMEMSSAQVTLQSNQRDLFTDDRNAVIPSLGAAWKFSDRLTYGLKFDMPFQRHGELPKESSIRFLTRSLDLDAARMEFQVGWAFRPDFSVGVGVGMARLSFDSGVSYRTQVPVDPSLPVGASNPSLALLETEVRQKGNVTVPSFSLGFRWALNPRWTVAGAYQSSLRGNLGLSAMPGHEAPVYVANDGYSSVPTGGIVETTGASLLAQTQYRPGSRRLALPGKATVGVRHRLNQFFTWELDVRHVDGSSMELPSSPSMITPSGTTTSQLSTGFRSGFGMSIMGEVFFGRAWTGRIGIAFDPALQDDANVNPLISGSRSAAFSGGAGYRIWGGEINVGYQFRQNKDIDSARLEGAWSSNGYRTTGTKTRVEGMGHLWSIGFKRSF